MYDRTLTLPSNHEWAAWVNGLADECRLPRTLLIQHAVERYARSIGYKHEPPDRVAWGGRKPRKAQTEGASA